MTSACRPAQRKESLNTMDTGDTGDEDNGDPRAPRPRPARLRSCSVPCLYARRAAC